MDHNENNQINLLISRYLTGNASSQEIEELYKWIQQSDGNRKYFHRQQDIWTALNPAAGVKDIDTAKAELKVLRKAGIRPDRRQLLRKVLVVWSCVAAAVILPLVVALGYLMADRREITGPDDVTITTAFGSLGSTRLPDGTTVWLNANSSLTYNPAMGGRTRNVSLQGEAYFDVKADEEHPFNVNTAYMTVTATGTEFNVNAYDASASITLVKGRVNVGICNQSLKLSPNEHLSMTDGKAVISRQVDTEKYCCWRNGILIFEDEPLLAICKRLQQIYDVEFDLAPELEDRTFRMILNGENISEIVHFFELAAPVACEIGPQKNADDTSRIKQKIRIMPL
ncbi:MAG: FecR family protein [Candidatus Cryptobacteroides sp.]